MDGQVFDRCSAHFPILWVAHSHRSLLYSKAQWDLATIPSPFMRLPRLLWTLSTSRWDWLVVRKRSGRESSSGRLDPRDFMSPFKRAAVNTLWLYRLFHRRLNWSTGPPLSTCRAGDSRPFHVVLFFLTAMMMTDSLFRDTSSMRWKWREVEFRIDVIFYL